MYVEIPYYKVYEVLIYWRDNKGNLKTFYKIGLIKVEREDHQLNYRYRKEIANGCKIFVLNEIELTNYTETLELESRLIYLAQQENHLDCEKLKLDKRFKRSTKGDLADYPEYFAGESEAFRTPERFHDLIKKLKVHFDNNPEVFYPKAYNLDLLHRLKR